MKTYKIILVKHSAKKEDGSRNLLSETILATCPNRGTAFIICDFLEKNTYNNKTLFPVTGDNNNVYGLTVTERSAADLINPY